MRLETEIPDLIARAREGDEEAIRDLPRRSKRSCGSWCAGASRRSSRTWFDSMDFVQSVWQSFFSDLRNRPLEFENVHHLRAFLAGVVRNKVYRGASQADQDREVRPGPGGAALHPPRRAREISASCVSPEPTPSQTVQASDRLAQLVAGCSPREVQVITLRHQGMTFEEIAARTGLGRAHGPPDHRGWPEHEWRPGG